MNNEKGFTLIEILASLVILAIIFMGAFNVFVFTNKATVSNNDKLVAINLGKATIERMKIQPFSYFEPPKSEPAPEYVGKDKEHAILYDANNCKPENCEKLYSVMINDKPYEISVAVSQTASEISMRLINVVVTVEQLEKNITNKVEGYISYGY